MDERLNSFKASFPEMSKGLKRVSVEIRRINFDAPNFVRKALIGARFVAEILYSDTDVVITGTGEKRKSEKTETYGISIEQIVNFLRNDKRSLSWVTENIKHKGIILRNEEIELVD